MIQSPKELRRQKGIVQQYIKNPYLLNGRKFTMRVYAVYTSLDPVRIYVYPEGFCHIATEKYSPEQRHAKNRYMHITNPDTSANRPFYRKNPRPFYWNFTELRRYMQKNGVNFENLWSKIKTLVAKTLLSGIDRIKQYSQKIDLSNSEDIMQENKYFELLGIDVLVDDTCIHGCGSKSDQICLQSLIFRWPKWLNRICCTTFYIW